MQSLKVKKKVNKIVLRGWLVVCECVAAILSSENSIFANILSFNFKFTAKPQGLRKSNTFLKNFDINKYTQILDLSKEKA